MKLKLFLVSVVSLGLITSQIATPLHALDNKLCDPETGEFFSTATAPLNSPDDKARQAKALSWVKSQMLPKLNAGDGQSTISTETDYTNDFVGKASGHFSIKPGHEITVDSSLLLTSPTNPTDDYRGLINGKLTISPTSGYTVKAYKVTDKEYLQSHATVGQVNPITGEWQIDLKKVPTANRGYWVFKLFDSSNVQIGKTWNGKQTYKDLEIQSYVLADKLYFKGSQPALTTGEWGPLNTSKGAKIFRVVNTATGEILAEKFGSDPTGLIRSYDLRPGDSGYGTSLEQASFVYSQATSLLLATGLDDKPMADQLLDGMKKIQITSGEQSGAFPTRVSQFSYKNPGNIHVGNNAFTAYSLVRYYEKYGDKNGALDMLKANLDFLTRMRVSAGEKEGLYTGGYTYSGGTYTKLTWVSTEHNTDLWHAFERAGRVLKDPKYNLMADDLEKSIVEKLWNYDEDRFNRGYKDDFESLDSNSWGSIFLNAVGENRKANSAINYTNNFYEDRGATKGYMHYIKPNAVRTVWFEGTYGVAQANLANGNKAKSNQIILDTYASQRSNGAWQYQLDHDPVYQMTTADSTSSTNWYLLSSALPNMIWSECKTDRIASEQPDEPAIPMAPNTGHKRY